MATNLIIQYSTVGAILVGAVIWVIVKAVKAHRHRNDDDPPGCGCCAFRNKCGSEDIKRR